VVVVAVVVFVGVELMPGDACTALLGRDDLASAAWLTAAGLSEDPSVRAFLITKAAAIGTKPGPEPSMSDS
jgi:hypothetical protein